VLIGREVVAAPDWSRSHDHRLLSRRRPPGIFCTASLGRFAARDINLTRLESRPTKRGLGDYCFVIEFEGHVADDVVADCLADLTGSIWRA